MTEKNFPKDIQILIVDDSPTARIVVKELLGRIGYKNVIEAQDGLEAVELIKKITQEGKEAKNLSLVIADWNMPRMSGLDLLVYLKGNSDYSSIPFLMFTAESDISLVTLAISSGADEFVVKPVNEVNLEEKLEKIWKKTQKT